MARIRTIKPEFFRHEDLAELPMVARLAFIGLWTLADREGRLEDRPKRIAVELFPYDRELDVDQVLATLASAGFVVRYEVDGQRYLAIPKFPKHQRISGTEAKTSSAIPPPPEAPETTKEALWKHSGSTLEAPERITGKGVVGKEDGGAAEPPPAPAAPSAAAESSPTEPPPAPVASPKPQRERKPSAWENLREDLRARRARALPGVLPDAELKPGALNAQLQKLTTDCTAQHGVALVDAYEAFLADTYARERDPPCPLTLFVAQWPKYASAAQRAKGTGPPTAKAKGPWTDAGKVDWSDAKGGKVPWPVKPESP